MKRILFILFILCLVYNVSYTQTSVRTETTGNRYETLIAASTGDTVIYIGTKPAGSAIVNDGTSGFIVGIAIGTPVASDTIIIKNATETVYQLIQPASAPFVYNVDLNVKVDSMFVIIQKKASVATYKYRLKY